jgi:hypothetical protein
MNMEEKISRLVGRTMTMREFVLIVAIGIFWIYTAIVTIRFCQTHEIVEKKPITTQTIHE